MKDWLIVGLLLGVAATFLLLAVANWLRAEMDERRWRRKLKEQSDAALIRERRYGSSKQARL